MAVEFDGVTTPQSTGAVPTPTDPVVVEQVPGHPESTGAVDAPPAAVTVEFGDLGTSSTGAVETPGPQSYGPEAKVIRSGRRAAAEPSQVTPETKTESKTQSADVPLPGQAH